MYDIDGLTREIKVLKGLGGPAPFRKALDLMLDLADAIREVDKRIERLIEANPQITGTD